MPKLTVTITQEADDKLRRYNRKRGDMSNIVNRLILEQLAEPT